MSYRSRPVISFVLACVFLAIMCIIGVWDAYVLTIDPTSPTVSAVVRAFARDYPISALLVGVLIGHLFWPVVSGREFSPKEIIDQVRNGGK